MGKLLIHYFNYTALVDEKGFYQHLDQLAEFRKISSIEDNLEFGSYGWGLSHGIEVIRECYEGESSRIFADHREPDAPIKEMLPDDFDQLKSERIAELSKSQQKEFKRAIVLAYNHQPLLDHLGIELLAEFDPTFVIELDLPFNQSAEDDYQDMRMLGFRDGDKHTEIMARKIQFYRAWAKGNTPTTKQEKKAQEQAKKKQRPPILRGMGSGGRPVEIEIAWEHLEVAIRVASEVIKIPSRKATRIKKTDVYTAIIDAIKEQTGASEATFRRWYQGQSLNRDALYAMMPESIQSRM